MDAQKLVEILLELRTASLQLGENPSEYDVKEVMHKYDMLFLGGKFNSIYSVELCHTIKKHFKIETNNDELNKFIPKVCATLHMKFEPLAKVEDISNPVPYCYQIELW